MEYYTLSVLRNPFFFRFFFRFPFSLVSYTFSLLMIAVCCFDDFDHSISTPPFFLLFSFSLELSLSLMLNPFLVVADISKELSG